MRSIIAAGAGLLTLAATSAHAEIVESANGGFASQHSVLVAADVETVWNELVHPENWWSHTWSGDSANLSLELRGGGCFCETIPGQGGLPDGSVEHMRVLAVFPHRMLRLGGALGPLQSEALSGALTITLREDALGTEISWHYVTGGQSRMDMEQMAPVVDRVQAEFLGKRAERLGGDIREG